MAKNQMFDQMTAAAMERLAGRDPLTIAENAGIIYDGNARAFRVSSMGVDLEIAYPDYIIKPAISGWHQLLVLHYLDMADGWPVSGRDMPFSQMQSGLIRGGGIDRSCEQAIASMKNLDEEVLGKTCEGLGGARILSNADVAWRIPFLPRFPVTLQIWLPDEEFPASGRLLVDESADHYFTIEDAVGVAELVLEEIMQSCSR